MIKSCGGKAHDESAGHASKSVKETRPCACVTLSLAADPGILRIPSVCRPVCSKTHINWTQIHMDAGVTATEQTT